MSEVLMLKVLEPVVFGAYTCEKRYVSRTALENEDASTADSRFRGGLVFKAHRRLYHSTLGSRVMKEKKVLCGQVRASANRGNVCA